MARTPRGEAKLELDPAKVSHSLFPLFALFPPVQFNWRFKDHTGYHGIGCRSNREGSNSRIWRHAKPSRCRV